MAKDVLLLRLEGPLQSWGGRSRWDVRDTCAEPTKSGVLGLLGCALGHPMRDYESASELARALRFGVRVEAPGRVMEDFQTVTGYLPTADGGYRHSGVGVAKDLARLRADGATPATIISRRFYLEDAAFLVALEEASAGTGVLGRCRDALLAPRWPLFLGRKACVPARPVFDEYTDRYDGVEDALARHPWSWSGVGRGRRRRPSERCSVYVEDPGGELTIQDVVMVGAIRQYGFRRAVRSTATPPSEEPAE